MKKAQWFKFHKTYKDMFSITPDEELGRIIKRLIKYFDVGEIKDIEKMSFASPTEQIVFSVLKQSADESILEYNKAVENGAKGARKRWKNHKSK